ncbi:Trk system potassium uptake protein TrkA [Maioricimonas rarisocia]|uniref:Trk system potassium uptake protein TrkA n=1 Tax=Maioricimonas rarisocia TaxID=2528026 RepID=A0A517ZBD1_9PLAN|nr:Trk system potassium transporter TrkA [Maioricimonas rarisocia]QDU39767.1 Trk system potassium uptake protein TrkA [Maioricimonas rarisocia]
MHIVILGAGTVGTSIAELLCANQHNVCIIDDSRAALDVIEEKLDVQTVHGSACEVIPLFQAGVQNAELCLAVTQRDEVNLIGASLSRAMGARRSVARIFNPAYRDISTFDYQRHFHIDRLLSLEQLTALELSKGVRKRELFAVEHFARGGVQVQEVGADSDARAVGRKLRDLELPSHVRIGLLSNGSRAWIPAADDVIQAGDRVTLIGQGDAIEEVKKRFERKTQAALRVIIVGGGEVGFHLARGLQRDRYRVVLMDTDDRRCEYLSQRLPKCTILKADATRRGEMEEARVGSADVFIATMGRDEDNIVCGVEARELGAKRILSVVRRPDYANVLEKLGIDVAVSPRKVMAREVLGMLAHGPIIGQSEIGGGSAAVWEIEIQKGAPITRAPLKEIQLQKSLIAAIVREEHVSVAGGDDRLQPGDTAVVLVQKDSEEQTLELFEPDEK